MECKRWESDGLLYVAGELQDEASAEFEQHLAGCEECSRELSEYREMFGEFSAEDLLSDEPSAECDAKILAAIDEAVTETEKAEPVVTMPGFFSVLMQRVAVPVAIFAIAVTFGVQIASNSGAGNSQVAQKADSAVVEEQKDSASDSGRIFIQGGGEGVIPVTLEK